MTVNSHQDTLNRVAQTVERLQQDYADLAYTVQEIGKLCLLTERGDERAALSEVLRRATEALPNLDLVQQLVHDGHGRPRGGIDHPDELRTDPTTPA